MADWWQQSQGFFVVGLIIALVVLGAFVNRWRRSLPAKAAAWSARVMAQGETGNPKVLKLLQSVSTVLVFREPAATLAPALAAAQPGGLWRLDASGQWVLPDHRDELVIRVRTALVPWGTDGGCALVVTEAADLGGIPRGDGDWRPLKAAVLAAAKARGMRGREVLGEALVRVPVVGSAESEWRR